MSNTHIVHHNTCPLCGSKILIPFLKCKDHTVSGKIFKTVSCSSCQFTLTQDAPDMEHIGPYYKSESYISHSDTKKGLLNSLYHFVRGLMLNRKRKLISKQIKPGQLLDIGCGTGYFLDHMKQHGWEVQGIEADEDARAFAYSNFDIKVQTPASIVEIETESIDVISMWHVLEHIHNLHEHMSTVHRILKPQGIVVIAVPNLESYDAVKYRENWAAYDVPRHLWHFSTKTMEQLAEKSGFSLSQKKRMPFDGFYVSIMSEQYQGNSFAFIKGSITGAVSWLASLINISAGSSVIYVLEKKSA